VSALDIFDVANRYAEGEISLSDVQDWLVPRLGAYLADPTSTASELAGLLELLSAEVASRETSADGARELVLSFLRRHPMITFNLAEKPTGSASNVIVQAGQLRAGSASVSWAPRPLPAGT